MTVGAEDGSDVGSNVGSNEGVGGVGEAIPGRRVGFWIGVFVGRLFTGRRVRVVGNNDGAGVGSNVGSDEGYIVGVVVEGDIVGNVVGLGEGRFVGGRASFLIGFFVGRLFTGLRVGLFLLLVGAFVGCVVRRLRTGRRVGICSGLGRFVGTITVGFVGELEGRFVRERVGAAVEGALVGALDVGVGAAVEGVGAEV